MLSIQESTPLLSDDEINNIFYDYDLYLSNSFYIIDKARKEYDENYRASDFKTHLEVLQKASSEGYTIVVKNMETYNSKIQKAANELGIGTDVHLYLVFNKEGGDSFDWHVDDRAVWVKMISGQKIFSLRTQANETVFINMIKLKKNQSLYIGFNEHRATQMGPSAMLSFGLPNQVNV